MDQSDQKCHTVNQIYASGAIHVLACARFLNLVSVYSDFLQNGKSSQVLARAEQVEKFNRGDAFFCHIFYHFHEDYFAANLFYLICFNLFTCFYQAADCKFSGKL